MNQPSDDPVAYFRKCYRKAENHKEIREPAAMNLATASRDGKPSNRMVLLKGFDEKGFVFYTNLKSRKSQQLEESPFASLCFYWEPLVQQVRIEGHVEPVSDEDADAYFASRPLKTRIGAWASKQSHPLKSQTTLMKEVARQTVRFASGNVPRPPFWSGYLLVPHYMEFWQKGEYRIHDRISYTREETGGWKRQLLYP